MKLTEAFQEALLLAAQLHAGQTRKVSGEPYVSHLLIVCGLVLEYGGDESEAIAALLHDAVEDQGGLPTLSRIRGQFGEDVGRIVLACSDSHALPKPPWRERKEAYLRRLRDAAPSVCLVSAADKLANARSVIKDLRRVGPAIWECFRGGRQGTLWYYHAVAEVLLDVYPGPLTEELDRTVGALRQVADSCDGG